MSEGAPLGSVRVSLPGSPESGYPVEIGSGIWSTAAARISGCCPAHRYALITDENVLALHAGALADRLRGSGLRVDVLAFPAGEANKTRATWAELSDAMLALGMGRDAAVLAVGGGVVGDLAGFVAATYLRGIPCVQLPTTLLAMIDSSVGGKTGVDAPAGKNLIGAFNQPKLVLADAAVLDTLPRREMAAGLAEAVKHGAIADAGYFASIESDVEGLLCGRPGPLVRLIARSVRLKAGIVTRDEREGGVRRMLNFGHTIGHAVEAGSGFELLHGEAISIGMVLEARLGESLGVTAQGTADRLAAVFREAGLPDRLPTGMDAARVAELTRSDKKARAGAVEYALIEGIGRAHEASGRWSVPVDDHRVMEVLEV